MRAENGLLIPADPRRRGCDLRLGPDAVTLMADSLSSALDWSDHGAGRVGRTGQEGDPLANGSWWVDSWSSGRGGAIGVAIGVIGRYVAETNGLRRSRRSPMNFLNRLFEDGVAVPLCAADTISRRVDVDRGVVSVLCAVLADRPELRPRLGDDDRVRALAEAILIGPREMVDAKVGIRRRTTEILAAMKALGYIHATGGRPLPDERTPSTERVAERVLERLRSGSHSREVEFTSGDVAAVVEQHYTGVAAWPFEALIR